MQVYSILRVVTARPSDDEMVQAEHRLYGHTHPSASYSVGLWQRDVSELIASGELDGKLPIFTGGTGLYFKALTGGLSDIPDIDPGVRDKWRGLLLSDGPEILHRHLVALDPQAAAELRPGDGQRIVRALEVLESSGSSIRHWQNRPGRSLVDLSTVQRIVVDPGRDLTNRRVAMRFERMVDHGALGEVKTLLDLHLDSELPAMRAIGVSELRAFLRGDLSRAEAINAAIVSTRQYAKRQRTWFRNQFGAEWVRIQDQNSPEIVQFAR